MTDQTSATEKHANLNVTVSFTAEDILRAAFGGYYDPEADETHAQGYLAQEMVEAGARLILEDHRYETRELLQSTVREQVVLAVTQAVESEEIVFGVNKKGTLRELVLDAATTWPNGRADTYGGQTNLRKLIEQVVQQELTQALRPVIDAAKAELVAAFRAQATDMILKAAADLNKTLGGR